MAVGLLGGLALFLFGLDQMSGALRHLVGGRMRHALARLTSNRFSAAATGAFVTAVIQSSSVTTALVVGFVSAGLMTLTQSVGVIMGANVGTTVTAQIIAFPITRYGLVPVAVGVALLLLSKKEWPRRLGAVLMGLGLIFFGMQLMSGATDPLRSDPRFIGVMQRMDQPLLAIVSSAVLTALIQSSSAVTGVVIVLASQGFISLEAGIALALGANVGTCATAVLASLGKSRDALRAALVHVLFNVLGVALWLGFIPELADLVRAISPSSPALRGAARLAAETPRQIANAHTVFNVANTALFIGFAGVFARVATWIVPVRPQEIDHSVRPRFLDDVLLDTPALALDRVRMELGRLGERAHHMVIRSLPVTIAGTREDLEALAALDDEVDVLHAAIVGYLGRLSQRNLGTADSAKVYRYVTAANSIEGIGDLVETNLVGAGLERLHSDLLVSLPTQEALEALHARVSEAMEDVLEALDASDRARAQDVMDAKAEINRLAARAEHHLAHRLAEVGPERLPIYRVESEIVEYLKRVYSFARRIARGILEVETGAPPPAAPEGRAGIGA